MTAATPAQAFFRSLNRLVGPLVQAGLGSPPPLSAGAVLVETNGRNSGLPRQVPLLSWRHGRHLYISTVRPGSQWVRNLETDPSLRAWLCGTPQPGQATIYRTPLGAIARLDLTTTPPQPET